MAVLEGGVSGALAGVGAEAASPLHIVRFPVSVGAGGAYRIGPSSGTMAVSLGATAEIFQLRYVTAASRIALVYKVSISAGGDVAAATAARLAFKMTVARAWTAAGTAGNRIVLTTNNGKLRTSYPTSEVNDAGISSTTGLGAGTKTLDATDIGGVSFGVGTGAITVSNPYTFLEETALFDADGEGQHPLVLANQEGFVIRNGGNAFPAGMTWSFTVNTLWLEVPAF